MDDQDPQQTRNTLLKGIIEVEKSQIPEDWQTEAADFLIKLLIKNPSLRLGHYGSFEGTSSSLSHEPPLAQRVQCRGQSSGAYPPLS